MKVRIYKLLGRIYLRWILVRYRRQIRIAAAAGIVAVAAAGYVAITRAAARGLSVAPQDPCSRAPRVAPTSRLANDSLAFPAPYRRVPRVPSRGAGDPLERGATRHPRTGGESRQPPRSANPSARARQLTP